MPVVASSTNETSAGAQNFSVPLPTGVQNGHLMIAGYVVGNNIYTVTPPAGWTTFEVGVQLSTGTVLVSIAWKFKASGDAAPVWGLSTTSTAKACGFIVALSGRAAPTFGTHVIRSSSSTTTVAPSVTPPAGSDLLAIFFDKVSSQTGVAPPAGMTELLEDIVSGGGAVSCEVAYQAVGAGATGTKTATYDVASALAYGVLMYAPPATNAAPVVNAGNDQSSLAGVEVTMTATDSDSDGTISSRAWSQIAGPAVSLTGGTTQTAKFTPVAAGIYTFTYTATDNLGATGTDSITITVSGNTSRPIQTTVNPGGWAVVGPQPTTTTAVADDDDSSYDETPTAPNNASVTFKLAPVNTGNIIIRTRGKQDVASPVITRTVELLQGASTVIAAFAPYTLTTDWVEHSFSLTTPQNAAVTDRTDLRVRITDLTA